MQGFIGKVVPVRFFFFLVLFCVCGGWTSVILNMLGFFLKSS